MTCSCLLAVHDSTSSNGRASGARLRSVRGLAHGDIGVVHRESASG